MPTGPFFAVTSVSGHEGSWHIVADGSDPAAVYDRATADIAGSLAGTSLTNLPLTHLPVKNRLERLIVLPRPQATALVGRRGMDSYERAGGHPGLVGIGGDGAGGTAPKRPGSAGPLPPELP